MYIIKGLNHPDFFILSRSCPFLIFLSWSTSSHAKHRANIHYTFQQSNSNTMTKEATTAPSSLPSSEKGHDAQSTDSEFPEGGLRAWLVVAGSSATMFCTFGYLTGFGYVIHLDTSLATSLVYSRVSHKMSVSTRAGMAHTSSATRPNPTYRGLARFKSSSTSPAALSAAPSWTASAQ